MACFDFGSRSLKWLWECSVQTRGLTQQVAEHQARSPLSLLQAKQPQFPQLLLVRPALQSPHLLCCPSLDTLQGFGVFLVMRSLKLSSALEVWPHHCLAHQSIKTRAQLNGNCLPKGEVGSKKRTGDL